MTAKAAKGLATAIRRELAALADPERARGAQAYLKSEMPCWGVPVPEVRAIVKRVFSTYPLESREDLEEAVLAVWTTATRREERLAAVVMTGDKRAKRFHDMEILPFYERLIREGAWWDLVDELAAHRLHLVLAAEPANRRRLILGVAFVAVTASRSSPIPADRDALRLNVARARLTNLYSALRSRRCAEATNHAAGHWLIRHLSHCRINFQDGIRAALRSRGVIGSAPYLCGTAH